MPNIIADFRRFQEKQIRGNPDESPVIAFAGELSRESRLLDYDEEDWWKLGESLNMSDDEIGALIEGTATWIVKEDVAASKQKPADWPESEEHLAPARVAANNPEPEEEEPESNEKDVCKCKCSTCDDEGCEDCPQCNKGCECCCCICDGIDPDGDEEEEED